MADEGAFLELLVANERVGRLLDVLVDPTQRARHKSTIMQLHAEVQRGSSYVEEAHRAGAIQVLTNLLARTTDEAVMDAVSRIISLCSGPMAAGGKLSSYSYGPITIRIREGALGDGLGAQVWSVAHILCRELLQHPEVVQGQQVLEIGSGTGLVGIMAALLGAQQVVLTDHEPQVLLNLRSCMHLNATSSSTASQEPALSTTAGQHSTPGGATSSHPVRTATTSHALEDLSDDEFELQLQPSYARRQQQHQLAAGTPGLVPFTDAELFDDAEYVEEFDLSTLLSPRSSAMQQARQGGPGAGAESAGGGGSTSTSWEVGNMAVRLLDWQESHEAMEAAAAAAAAGTIPSSSGGSAGAAFTAAGLEAGSGSGGDPATSSNQQQPPGVPLEQQFPVVLGNEVMYERAHARLVAAALHHRLAPGGRALLCCAVRDQGVFDTFRDACAVRGLRYRAVRVQPEEERDVGGIRGRERDYEGGYLMMAVDHSSSPAGDWHRDDFVAVV